MTKQCILPLANDLIDAWKMSCVSNGTRPNSPHDRAILLLQASVADISCEMTAVCACRLQDVSMLQTHTVIFAGERQKENFIRHITNTIDKPIETNNGMLPEGNNHLPMINHRQ